MEASSWYGSVFLEAQRRGGFGCDLALFGYVFLCAGYVSFNGDWLRFGCDLDVFWTCFGCVLLLFRTVFVFLFVQVRVDFLGMTDTDFCGFLGTRKRWSVGNAGAS